LTNPTKKFVGEEEWENFQPTEVLSSDVSGKLWNNINHNTNSTAAHASYFRWIAVAASVLLVVGLSWQFIFKKPATSIIPASTAAITKHTSNTTPEKKQLTLSDGSTVELLPGSKISYPENFNPVKREVILTGEATFDVARDVAKPFSVYCNSVLITVLGTRFTVNSYEANTLTKVILHDGRVMVKISDSSSRDNKNEYYLTPGDVFIYKKGSNRFDSLSARILHLEKDKDDRYLFDNSPLDVVFDQLQIIYNTKINYNRAELGNRTFIGKIDKSEPVDHILKSIALLNNFRLQKQADGFTISN
jgi:ferric-dicitrate binding protein FerR (iron transport regulator)